MPKHKESGGLLSQIALYYLRRVFEGKFSKEIFLREETLIKRVMPHSIEAEQSVIGAMVLDNESIALVENIITGEDFYHRQYGIIFDTMVELYEEGRPVDLLTLQSRLQEKEVPPEVSSMNYIGELIASVSALGQRQMVC